MRIDCRPATGELNQLRLHLYSTDMKFEWRTLPLDNNEGKIVFNPDNQACIKFHDTYEIDNLINMLQRFKEESRKRLGWWE